MSSASPRSNVFPNCWIDRPEWGAEMYPEESGFAGVGGRGVGLPQWTSGHVDSPYLYPISGGQIFAHQQQVLYHVDLLTGWVLESQAETTLRLNRHSAEAIINSASGVSKRLTPWLAMPELEQYPPDSQVFYQLPELLDHVAMLRGKNLEEILFFAGYSDPEAGYKQWKATADAVHAAYAARFVEYKRLNGDAPPNSPDVELAMLEFTLPREGQPFTLDIESPDVTPSNSLLSELMVIVEGLGDYQMVAPGRPHTFEYLVNVECSVNIAGLFGRAYAWDFTGEGEWVLLDAVHQDTQYQFYTPDHSMRTQYVIPYTTSRQFIDPVEGTFQLKLVHGTLTTPTSKFTTKYDLVQVIPRRVGIPTICCAGEDVAQSDMNYDESDDPDDLAAFADAWAEGRHKADVDLSGDVDAADFQRFLNAYATGD